MKKIIETDDSELTFVIDDTAYKGWNPNDVPVITPEMKKRKEELFKKLDKMFLHKNNDEHSEE